MIVKLAAITACVGLVVSLVTIGTLIYNAGRERERLAAAMKHLCEQVVVLQKITVSEHAEYTLTINWDRCD